MDRKRLTKPITIYITETQTFLKEAAVHPDVGGHEVLGEVLGQALHGDGDDRDEQAAAPRIHGVVQKFSLLLCLGNEKSINTMN